jgi:transposase-like protein
MEQLTPGRPIIRYSSAFKRKVVNEIEHGKLTVAEAKRLYDITGNTTIRRWLKSFGKHDLPTRVVRIEMKDEADKVKAQEKKIRELQAALSDAHLRIIVLESTVSVLEKDQTEVEKKSAVTKSSRKR